MSLPMGRGGSQPDPVRAAPAAGDQHGVVVANGGPAPDLRARGDLPPQRARAGVQRVHCAVPRADVNGARRQRGLALDAAARLATGRQMMHGDPVSTLKRGAVPRRQALGCAEAAAIAAWAVPPLGHGAQRRVPRQRVVPRGDRRAARQRLLGVAGPQRSRAGRAGELHGADAGLACWVAYAGLGGLGGWLALPLH